MDGHLGTINLLWCHFKGGGPPSAGIKLFSPKSLASEGGGPTCTRPDIKGFFGVWCHSPKPVCMYQMSLLWSYHHTYGLKTSKSACFKDISTIFRPRKGGEGPTAGIQNDGERGSKNMWNLGGRKYVKNLKHFFVDSKRVVLVSRISCTSSLLALRDLNCHSWKNYRDSHC